MTKDEEQINGSGLFFFNSRLSEEKKLEILKWYNYLPDIQKDYINILRSESSDETEFFANGD